eukprot:GHVS01036573.1.p1 GENE.GHVS01036573.1~~GHVS01036573.1.p1  ORF type:complete len:351 (+),score=67.79 GHVS01036573.1:158-1210(+)
MKSFVESVALSLGVLCLFCLLASQAETVKRPAIPVCHEPLRLECPDRASPLDANAPCRCSGNVVKRRDEKCPENSTALHASASFASASLRCSVRVVDDSIGVCNHGMVVDVRKNMCMASRTMEALCHCPESFFIQGEHCVKEVGSPTVGRRRLLTGGSGRRLSEAASADSSRTDGVRLVGNAGGGRAIVQDMECRCPGGMITAAQFRRRTADSTIDKEEEEADKIVRPGHGGCVLVEYHDLLNKCTDDKGKVTVDSDGNPTGTNDCSNYVVVLADKYCKQDGKGKEKWEEKCAGEKDDGRRGFGFLVNDKHCWCEKKQVQPVHWACVRGGKLDIERDANGVVSSATCDSS